MERKVWVLTIGNSSREHWVQAICSSQERAEKALVDYVNSSLEELTWTGYVGTSPCFTKVNQDLKETLQENDEYYRIDQEDVLYD